MTTRHFDIKPRRGGAVSVKSVSCTRRISALIVDNYSQKEYEAMKLVNLFDKMVSDGVMKPARIGPDGRPQPVEHVLEFREHLPNRPQS